jgi:hypothetical protein
MTSKAYAVGSFLSAMLLLAPSVVFADGTPKPERHLIGSRQIAEIISPHLSFNRYVPKGESVGHAWVEVETNYEASDDDIRGEWFRLDDSRMKAVRSPMGGFDIHYTTENEEVIDCGHFKEHGWKFGQTKWCELAYEVTSGTNQYGEEWTMMSVYLQKRP